jgi:Fe-S cluster assembly scaffold protein SufB
MGNVSGSPIHLSFKIIDEKSVANQVLAASESRDFYIEECHNDKSNHIARKDCVYAPNAIVRYEKESYEEKNQKNTE